MAAQSVNRVVAGVKTTIPGNQVFVVDDGSRDPTSMVGRKEGVNVLRHLVNRGKGAALATGIREALRHPDCRAVITMDADQQHDPAYLPVFIKQFHQSGADFILGKRARTLGRMPGLRILANSVTSFLLSLRSGLSIRDSQCGFRLIRKTVLQQVPIRNTGAQAETELLLKAVLRGFQVEHVPISTIYNGQHSFIRPMHDIIDFLRIYIASFFNFLF